MLWWCSQLRDLPSNQQQGSYIYALWIDTARKHRFYDKETMFANIYLDVVPRVLRYEILEHGV